MTPKQQTRQKIDRLDLPSHELDEALKAVDMLHDLIEIAESGGLAKLVVAAEMKGNNFAHGHFLMDGDRSDRPMYAPTTYDHCLGILGLIEQVKHAIMGRCPANYVSGQRGVG